MLLLKKLNLNQQHHYYLRDLDMFLPLPLLLLKQDKTVHLQINLMEHLKVN